MAARKRIHGPMDRSDRVSWRYPGPTLRWDETLRGVIDQNVLLSLAGFNDGDVVTAPDY
jgi:hypothetical protein